MAERVGGQGELKANTLSDVSPVADLGLAIGNEGFERYELTDLVTRAENAVLVTSKDRHVRRDLVMKRLEREAGPARERFLREARIQAQLEHPGIVPVYDMGIDPEGKTYFTMQRVNGTTLRSVLDDLAKGKPSVVKNWSREKLLGAFRQTCLTLHYAHERGVVHRNVKPENIVLGNFGEVHVVDWALAKLVKPGDASVDLMDASGPYTGAQELIGTPGYAAPEQLLDGGKVDRRADVYSLGAVLFELLCSKPLHKGKNLAELLDSTYRGADARPSVRVPNQRVPAELEQACVKACAPYVVDRFPTARALHDAVDHFLEGDRDAAERNELAARHGRQAEETAVRAIVADTGGIALRRAALGHAGRALALDPESAGAQRALMALLAEPPSEMPPEALKRYEDEEVEIVRQTGRFGAAAYLVFVAALSSVLISGVRSWAGFFCITVPIIGAALLWMHLAREPKRNDNLIFAIYGLSSLGIAFSAGLFGALVLLPAYIVAQTLAYNLGILKHRRWSTLIIGVACFLVPYILERVGVLPQTYVFRDGAMTILPVIRNFPETPVRIGVAIVSVITILVLTFYVWKIHDTLADLRHRLYMHSWQLAQFLPAEARSKLFARATAASPAVAGSKGVAR